MEMLSKTKIFVSVRKGFDGLNAPGKINQGRSIGKYTVRIYRFALTL